MGIEDQRIKRGALYLSQVRSSVVVLVACQTCVLIVSCAVAIDISQQRWLHDLAFIIRTQSDPSVAAWSRQASLRSPAAVPRTRPEHGPQATISVGGSDQDEAG
jgi:hypothetical protein